MGHEHERGQQGQISRFGAGKDPLHPRRTHAQQRKRVHHERAQHMYEQVHGVVAPYVESVEVIVQAEGEEGDIAVSEYLMHLRGVPVRKLYEVRKALDGRVLVDVQAVVELQGHFEAVGVGQYAQQGDDREVKPWPQREARGRAAALL